jgi:molybdopterin/thiamine biosynthesis adenylyltransferase
MDVNAFLAEKADGVLLSWADQCELMTRFDFDCAETERQILQAGYLPARYQRNQQMISTDQQLQLLQSRVAVVGCGGLGGYILEQLARLGVGQIIAIDPDVFEEHNLNRQLLASIELLGTAKAEAARQRISEINPAVRVNSIIAAFSKEKGQEMLGTVDLVIDAVDNIQVRFDLAETCAQLNVPLVHGAIGGWYGQVATVYPGDDALQKLYGNWNGGAGVESELGNPSFTPAVIASLQVAEASKVLLGQGRLLCNSVLSINLLEMQFEEIPL